MRIWLSLWYICPSFHYSQMHIFNICEIVLWNFRDLGWIPTKNLRYVLVLNNGQWSKKDSAYFLSSILLGFHFSQHWIRSFTCPCISMHFYVPGSTWFVIKDGLMQLVIGIIDFAEKTWTWIFFLSMNAFLIECF